MDYNFYITLEDSMLQQCEVPLNCNPIAGTSAIDGTMLASTLPSINRMLEQLGKVRVLAMRVEENTGRTYRCKVPNTDIGVGETAIGRFRGGQFIVQADSFAHDWSHGWHRTDWRLWEEVRNG